MKVLVVTGGHDFEREAFFETFDAFSDLEYTEIIQPEANVWISGKEVDKFDVLVFYDMFQVITEEQKAAYLNVLHKGKGMVFLHHSLVSYQKWDEFLSIVGGRYHLDTELPEGEKDKASGYSHDEDMNVTVYTQDHPITAGMSDFTIHDETYSNYEVLPEVTVLLKTDHPKSTPQIAWCHQYGKSNIVYLQLGHDHHAYQHPDFRKFLEQAIRWAAK